MRMCGALPPLPQEDMHPTRLLLAVLLGAAEIAGGAENSQKAIARS